MWPEKQGPGDLRRVKQRPEKGEATKNQRIRIRPYRAWGKERAGEGEGRARQQPESSQPGLKSGDADLRRTGTPRGVRQPPRLPL